MEDLCTFAKNLVFSFRSHITTFEIVDNFALFQMHLLLNIYGKKSKKILGNVFKLPLLLYAVTC